MRDKGSTPVHGFFVASLLVTRIRDLNGGSLSAVVQHDVTYDGIGTSPTSVAFHFFRNLPMTYPTRFLGRYAFAKDLIFLARQTE
jgi:hypothetical protein